jgi:hypothetical protein
LSFSSIQAEQQRVLDLQRQKARPMKEIMEQEALLEEHRVRPGSILRDLFLIALFAKSLTHQRVEEYYENLKRQKELLQKQQDVSAQPQPQPQPRPKTNDKRRKKNPPRQPHQTAQSSTRPGQPPTGSVSRSAPITMYRAKSSPSSSSSGPSSSDKP